MQAQHPPLQTHAAQAQPQALTGGLFQWIGKVSGVASNATDYHAIRVQADWLCVLVSFACLVFAMVEGVIYHNISQALAWGLPLFFTSLLVTRLYAGSALTMHLNAFLLVGMGALHVHIARGLLEFHFSFFMLLPVMLAYRDIRPLLSMGLFILIHHLLFDMLQRAGFDCYVFRGPFSGLPAVALHGFYVAVEVLLLSIIARTLQQHALAAEESMKLLASLDQEKGVDLRLRAQADPQGVVSPVGRVFNDYADNMAFVVAAFNMLRADVRDLSDIARELGTGNSQQLEESAQAARKLREFVQQLGSQTRMGQSTAELSKKLSEDCFDLLNELNQSLEQLQKISKQAFDCSQQIQKLHRETEIIGDGPASGQLQAVYSILENLNERANNFMARMEVLKSGLSAIENQVVSIDRATHQWVENGHGNQRQGWEVLGSMEGMQARTENAFRILGESVQTILRSDDLMREMEKRFSRFRI